MLSVDQVLVSVQCPELLCDTAVLIKSALALRAHICGRFLDFLADGLDGLSDLLEDLAVLALKQVIVNESSQPTNRPAGGGGEVLPDFFEALSESIQRLLFAVSLPLNRGLGD